MATHYEASRDVRYGIVHVSEASTSDAMRGIESAFMRIGLLRHLDRTFRSIVAMEAETVPFLELLFGPVSTRRWCHEVIRPKIVYRGWISCPST